MSKKKTEPFIKTTVALTKRQMTFGTKEASRAGISFSDYLRRVFDDAIERRQPKGLAEAVYNR